MSDEAVEAAAEIILRGIDEGHHAYKIAHAALEAAAGCRRRTVQTLPIYPLGKIEDKR